VVGAPEKTISGVWAKGRVYVFKRTGQTWSQVVGLQASNGQTYDLFGSSVAIDGQMIIAGAPYTDHTGKTDAGSAYIFRFENNSWIEKKILSPADATSYGFFGFAVDISGATVAIGAYNTTASFVANTGAVYTYNNTDFTGTNWVFGQKLGPDDKQAEMRFGYALDLEGDRLLVGAPYYDDQGHPAAGRVIGFKRTNGQWGSDINLSSFITSEQAGTAVAIDGSYSFFAYPGYSDNSGRVMIYNMPSFTKYVYDDNKDANRHFGSVMAAHNGQYIIGTGPNTSNGAVFFGVLE
jgi:drug/metabolite transporter superfamily protein YnfA